MSGTRTIVEGDLNKKPIQSDLDKTRLETAPDSGLPSFKTARDGSRDERPGACERTQIFQPAGESVAAARLIGWLYSFTRKPQGEFFVLYEGRNTIGAAGENTIVLDDPGVSQKHCYILHRAGSKVTLIKDEGSTNGTLVNGKDIALESCALHDGDEILFGKLVFCVRLVKEALPTA
jgi:hypothetical protein